MGQSLGRLFGYTKEIEEDAPVGRRIDQELDLGSLTALHGEAIAHGKGLGRIDEYRFLKRRFDFDGRAESTLRRRRPVPSESRSRKPSLMESMAIGIVRTGRDVALGNDLALAARGRGEEKKGEDRCARFSHVRTE